MSDPWASLIEGGQEEEQPIKEITAEEPEPESEPELDDLTSIVSEIQELLDTDDGIKLALKLKSDGDTEFIIYQGLLSNVWGRVTHGRIRSYNSRLTRLLNKKENLSTILLER